MNDYNQQIRAMQQAAERAAEQDIRMTVHLLAAYFIVIALYFIFAALTCVHCAARGPEKNNASWMMLILLMPILGPLCYWIFRPRRAEDFSIPSRGVFPAPPPPTSQSIAAEINAEMAARPKGPKWVTNQPR
jgi:hypothetical protein